MYKILVAKSERKRPLGRPRRRWNGNIKKYLKEIDLEGVDWINLAMYRGPWWVLVKAIMNNRVPKREGNFFTNSATVKFLKDNSASFRLCVTRNLMPFLRLHVLNIVV
jgi:hypothetical protein